MNTMRYLATIEIVCGLSSYACADTPIAFVGAKIIPIGAPEIDVGTLVIEGQKIVAIGTKDQVAIPAGAQVITLDGKVLFPGLVCTHSHIGGIGGADGSSPIQ